MPNRLSHSSVSRFQACPKSWEYHYVKRLRPEKQSAALLFGTAVDRALTALLKPESDKTPEAIFDYFWRFQEINGKETYLTTATNIVYANSDFDDELLQPDDIEKMKEILKFEDPMAEVTKAYEEKDYAGFDGLPDDRKKVINVANWFCLYRKGHLMVKAVREKVFPNIEEVLSTQEYVSLENNEDDSVIGYPDTVVRWKGIDTPVILDFKTSSIEYDEDSVSISPQLTLYLHALSDKYKTRKAGFIVLHKHVKKNKTKVCTRCGSDGSGKRHKTCDVEVSGKRCAGEWKVTLDPEIYIQTIISDIPPQTEEIVIDNIDFINESIKNGVYHRNFSNCIRPWGRCPYFNKCYKGSNDGLIEVGSK